MKALICNQNKRFLEGFSDYLQKKTSDVFIDSFSAVDKAADCLRSGKSFDLVIGPEELMNGAPKDAVCVITGSKTYIPEDKGKEICLNIYQRRDGIVADLKRIIALKVSGSSGLMNESGDARIISVISPQGGSGKTTTAYYLAAAAAAGGHNPVFVSLEPFATLDKLCEAPAASGFGDIVLRLNDSRDLCPVVMEKMYRNEHNINMLPIPDNLDDLLFIDDKGASRLLDSLSQLPDVDLIVVDIGLPPSGTVVEILKKSRVIVIAVNDSSMGEAKLQSMKKDPFLSLSAMSAEMITLWNKMRSERKLSENELQIPFSENIAKGVSAVQVLSSNGSLLQSCRKIINTAKK